MPDYRIVAGNYEIGAAWKKISKRTGLPVGDLDDPSFPATIYARWWKPRTARTT